MSEHVRESGGRAPQVSSRCPVLRAAGCVLACLVLGVTAACRATLPDDPDRAPGLARDVFLGAQVQDTLDCGRGDCRDWFRIEVTEPGTLTLIGESRAYPPELGRPRSERSGIELFLGDDRARALDRVFWADRGELVQKVVPGYYFVSVRTSAQEPLTYVLRTDFAKRIVRKQPPTRRAPTPARVETIAARIVELEATAGRVEGVVFRVDAAERLRTGLAGRLRRGGVVIGKVEITEIYGQGGGRARLVGEARERIDASTELVFEVRVPSR